MATDGPWYEDKQEIDDQETGDESDSIREYDLISTPNDFNVATMISFVERGAVIIPGFQRNYVWDIKRASKLIESILIGLPIPQIFLYEEKRNKFLVIDGQQRLMSIFYFFQQRFPRKERRAELRRIVDINGSLPVEIFSDDEYFEKFNLKLPSQLQRDQNPYDGLNYKTLGAFAQQFDLRPIRNVIIKQISPEGDDSSVHEIFHRLNSGGVPLTAQEIRMGLYHSKFYEMLSRINTSDRWRRFVGLPEPDISLKDMEFLLRAFALAMPGQAYNPPMSKFLNTFSKQAKKFSDEQVATLENAFMSFCEACDDLGERAFRTQKNRFSVTIFESIFAAVVGPEIWSRNRSIAKVTPQKVDALKNDSEFSVALQEGSTQRPNVELRVRKAKEFLLTN